MKKPKKPVRGSRTGRPIMVLLDLLGKRWTLRVVWELRAEPASFRELQSRCDELSPTSLNARLSDLKEAGIVERDDGGYALTGAGHELIRALAPLDQWAKRWM